MIAGCSSTSPTTSQTESFSGTRYSTFDNGSEKLIVYNDGTYKQFLEAKNHAKLVTVGRWSMGQAPANSAYTGAWIVLQGYATPWQWLASPGPTAQRTPTLMSTDGFNGVSTLAVVPKDDDQTSSSSSDEYSTSTSSYGGRSHHRLSPAEYDLAVVLGLMFTAMWVMAIVAAAQRGQIMWLVLIVLFPCCATPIFAFSGLFGRSDWRQPRY